MGAHGGVSWRGRSLFLTEVLIGEDVAFDEVDEGVWTLFFGAIRLARFDERTRTLTELPVARAPK